MSLPKRHERSALRDQYVAACDPNNPEVVGPWVWSWHRTRAGALRACARLNESPDVSRRYYVLTREELDARWKRFLP